MSEMSILRLQSVEELELLQSRIKSRSKDIKVHESLVPAGRMASLEKLLRETPQLPPDQPIETASRKPQKRSRRIPGYVCEADVLKSILAYLRVHPRVSWVVRINSGALRYENRFIKFGQPGFPDVIGQTKEGLLIGVEVKASNGHASPEQQAFIDKINEANGLGCVAKSIDDVKALLSARL